jgi:hypothetical protein
MEMKTKRRTYKQNPLSTYTENHPAQSTYEKGDASSEVATVNSCPFKLKKRMPFWYPDAIDVPSPTGKSYAPGQNVQFLFQEEALHKNGSNDLVPFPVPHSQDGNGNDIPFQEPTDPSDWASFHEWMLGTGVPPTSDSDCQLIKVARDLAKGARLCNAALYRLRRIHFYYKMCKTHKTTTVDMSLIPPYNKHQGGLECGIPEDPLPVLDETPGSDFCTLASNAEKNWQDACSLINQYIEKYNPPKGVPHLAVDMVQVNRYIVSIRVILLPQETVLNERIKELGGSSSQVSVSSAFSSPSDWGLEIRGRRPGRPKAGPKAKKQRRK